MKGVKVSDCIVPMSSLDTYPTHLDVFGKGGIHSVDTILNRNAITVERRSQGMFSFTKENESMYALLGGITNDKWIKLFDFIDNKVNFNIACDPNYILLGNQDGVAKPSPALIDVQLDIINLRRKLNKVEVLEHKHIWIGDKNNTPVAQEKIEVDNLPLLGAAQFPLPFGIESIALPNPTFEADSPLAYVLSGAWLPQIYAGNPGKLDYTQTETIISSTLALSQIRIAQALKRIDNGGMIVKSKTINFSWENPLANLIPEPIAQLYDYGTSYTFKEAQALDVLGDGLLKNSTEGILSKAISGKDYVDLASPVANMKLALIRPFQQDEEGNDVAKLLARVDRLPEDNMPDLTFIMQSPSSKIPSAQGLSDLSPGGILKSNPLGVVSIASGGKIPLLDDYVDPLSLQVEIAETKAFATAEAAAAEAAAIAAGIAYFTEQMLPYSLIPIVPVGLSISGAIAAAAATAASAKSSADNANTRIDNLSVAGDVIGTNMGSDTIVTVFTPNPTFSGTKYMRIPAGSTAERPINSVAGMIRYNIEI